MNAAPIAFQPCIIAFVFLFPVWLLHLIPLLLVAVPVWFFCRRQVKWNRWDFAIVVLPFAVWSALMMAHNDGKTLSNLAEGFIIGCLAPFAPVIRALARNRVNQKGLAFVLLVVVCLLAAGLWVVVPPLPE